MRIREMIILVEEAEGQRLDELFSKPTPEEVEEMNERSRRMVDMLNRRFGTPAEVGSSILSSLPWWAQLLWKTATFSVGNFKAILIVAGVAIAAAMAYKGYNVVKRLLTPKQIQALAGMDRAEIEALTARLLQKGGMDGSEATKSAQTIVDGLAKKVKPEELATAAVIAAAAITEQLKETPIAESIDTTLEETYDGDGFFEKYGWLEWPDGESLTEAEYQGRNVTLNKPMRGDVKKFKVYVKNEKGNVVKVNFGDKDMKIRKSNPEARKSFRARHNCDDPGPKWKARYWSCKKW